VNNKPTVDNHKKENTLRRKKSEDHTDVFNNIEHDMTVLWM